MYKIIWKIIIILLSLINNQKQNNMETTTTEKIQKVQKYANIILASIKGIINLEEKEYEEYTKKLQELSIEALNINIKYIQNK